MKNIKLVFDEQLSKKIFDKPIKYDEYFDHEGKMQESILDLTDLSERNEGKQVSYAYNENGLLYHNSRENIVFEWINLYQVLEKEEFFIIFFVKNVSPNYYVLSQETIPIIIPYKMIIEGNGEDLRDFALRKINFSDGYLYK